MRGVGNEGYVKWGDEWKEWSGEKERNRRKGYKEDRRGRNQI